LLESRNAAVKSADHPSDRLDAAMTVEAPRSGARFRHPIGMTPMRADAVSLEA
jgi:hypothetical protein